MPFLFTISNEPKIGDIVSVKLIDGNDVEKTYSYEVEAGDDNNDIVTELMDLINADIYFTAVLQTVYTDAGLLINQVYNSNYGGFSGLVTIQYSEDSYSPAQTLSFDEDIDSFESFLSYHPEFMVAIGAELITFKDGNLWTHDSEKYNSFYGVDYESYITIVFNESMILKKQPQSVSQIGNTVWDIPEFESNVFSRSNVFQKTSIRESEFVYLEGSPSATIKRDINSNGGKINGNFMKGNYFIARVRKESASNIEYITSITLYYIPSPLTKT